MTEPGSHLNIKTVFPRYGDSHVKDKTVVRQSYLYHGNSYTSKMTSLYCDGPQVNKKHTNDLVQACSNSSALAMELLQSCTKPLILEIIGRRRIFLKIMVHFIVHTFPADDLSPVSACTSMTMFWYHIYVGLHQTIFSLELELVENLFHFIWISIKLLTQKSEHDTPLKVSQHAENIVVIYGMV